MTDETQPAPDPRATYAQMERRHGAALDAARAIDASLTRRRIATFLAAFVCVVVATTVKGWAAVVWAILAAVGLAAFIASVAAHRRVARRMRREERLRVLAEAGPHRLDRRWDLL